MGINIRFVDEVPPVNAGRKPDSGQKTARYARIARKLKANPNRWALVASVRTRHQASYAMTHLRKHGLTVASRKVNGGWFRVYAQYEA